VTVAVDSQDRVFVHSRSDHPLMLFDTEGNFLASWGEGILEPRSAHGLFIDCDDNVYCTDLNHCVRKFNAHGELVMTIGTPGSPGAAERVPFNEPTDLGVSADGKLFVADGYKNHNVHRFSASGRLEFSWGEKGICPGQFSSVHCARVDRHGRVWVCDRENIRIQLFTAEGRFLEEHTALPKPQCLFFDPREDVVYVAELWQLSIYTLEGELVTQWGGRRQSDQVGGFIGAPHGVGMDSQGSLYVSESGVKGRGRVQKFVRR
jgi:sugar lactone lactonase YvrE